MKVLDTRFTVFGFEVSIRPATFWYRGWRCMYTASGWWQGTYAYTRMNCRTKAELRDKIDLEMARKAELELP